MLYLPSFSNNGSTSRDRNGVSERLSLLGFSGSDADPQDNLSNRIVAEHNPQVPEMVPVSQA